MNINEIIIELFWKHPTKIVFTIGFLSGVVFTSLFL
jgi:hypothetical protein